VARLSADTVQLGAELAGAPATLTLTGSAHLHGVADMLFDVEARRVDGNGQYSVHLHLDPKRMDGILKLQEPANGPLENILSLPGLGDLHADARLTGLRSDEKLDLSLQAGDLRAQAQGSIDLNDL
jgi:hypothetical protein